MSVVESPVRLGISLGYQTSDHHCVMFAQPLFEQMSSGKYDECATMPLPRNTEAWEAEHRTARKRAWKAQHAAYTAMRVDLADYEDDVALVNASRAIRQGRPMSQGYMERPSFSRDEYPCELHAIRHYAVLDWNQRLMAYLVMYRAGDLALVSQVLGHGDHEPNGIMYLLFREALAAEGAIAPGVCVYNRWDSGTDGLRFLKARIGFERTAVEWLP